MDVRKAFERCASLGEALQVGFAAVPVWNVVEVVHQDELTLDVVMQAEAGGPAIVLDCT